MSTDKKDAEAKVKEEKFRKILSRLHDNARNYQRDPKNWKFINYATEQDNIFYNAGWTQEEFYAEVERRVKQIG